MYFSWLAVFLALPSKSLTQSSAAQKSIGVLVVGAGSISREYALHHFIPSATNTVVVGIVDLEEEKAADLAAEVGSAQAGIAVTDVDGNKYKAQTAQRKGTPVPHFTSLDAALRKVPAEIVYIGTTPKSHRNIVEQSLKSGKHVLLEKPLAATMDDADAIVSASDGARTNEPPVFLAMNIGMRYNAALHDLRRRILVDKELGSPSKLRAALKTCYERWPREWQVQPWCAGREEGGPLREVGTHFFSALLEFSGAHDRGDQRVPVTARVKAIVEYPEEKTSQKMGEAPCEEKASGVIELHGGALPPGGLVVDLTVATDSPRDIYELTIEVDPESPEHCSPGGPRMKHRSLTLFDFCSLRNDDGEILVRDASYGRQDCVKALIATMSRLETLPSSFDTLPSIVTAQHGRNAQRILEAILESKGDWRDIKFD